MQASYRLVFEPVAGAKAEAYFTLVSGLSSDPVTASLQIYCHTQRDEALARKM
jgi:hypothetical protein